MFAIGLFAQEFRNGQQIGFSEYGDLLIYEDSSNSSRYGSSTFEDTAGCRCYQGYDKASNDQSKLYGSCCWKPITTSYPVCGGGCV